MALVHEQLYQSEDLAKIDFAEYIQNLTANLFSSYDVILDRLALKINVDNIHLSVDAAISCGLIINELVSNFLKYAFPDGQFDASFFNGGNPPTGKQSPTEELVLDLDFRNTETLGLQLVTALTGQLEGTIVLSRDKGTEFQITFQDKSKVPGN